MWAAAIAAAVLIAFPAVNIGYQVVSKPTELLFPLDSVLDKPPSETWGQYGALFREYSTGTITPELLAALAQVEGAGNPVARTYWRWRRPGTLSRSTSPPRAPSACTR